MVLIQCVSLDLVASPRERKHCCWFGQLPPNSTPSILGITCWYFSYTFLAAPEWTPSVHLALFPLQNSPPTPPLSWTVPHLHSSCDGPVLLVYWAPFLCGLMRSIPTMSALPWVDLRPPPHQARPRYKKGVAFMPQGWVQWQNIYQSGVCKCDERGLSCPKGRTWAN